MKIALFFGAGMSVVFDKPTTVKFKELLQEVSGVSHLHDSLLTTFLSVTKFPDVEYILKSLEDITEFSKSEGGDFFSHLSDHNEGHTLALYSNNRYKYSQVLTEIKNLKSTIEEQVFEKYSWNHENDDLLDKIFDPIIEKLDSMNNTIKIFTTNYDQTIEQYCSQKNNFNCNDGFKLEQSGRHFLWNKGRYDELNVKEKINFQLYKLHGSLNWKNHVKYGIERTTSERKPNDTNYDKDFLIYPSLSPKDGMIHEPYSTIREKFKDFLREADVCIVIGFSFRDEHLNDVFNEFISSNKKLIVISPSALSDIANHLLKSPITYDKVDNEFDLKIKNIMGYEEKISEETIQQVATHIGYFLKK